MSCSSTMTWTEWSIFINKLYNTTIKSTIFLPETFRIRWFRLHNELSDEISPSDIRLHLRPFGKPNTCAYVQTIFTTTAKHSYCRLCIGSSAISTREHYSLSSNYFQVGINEEMWILPVRYSVNVTDSTPGWAFWSSVGIYTKYRWCIATNLLVYMVRCG